LLRRQAFLDLTGLLPRKEVEKLAVTWSLPRDWEPGPMKRNPIYTHQQFKSPTGRTGVGVAHLRLPLPLSASAIVWLAKHEYVKRTGDQNDGKLINRWTDAEGREWFEAENNKYHARGFVIARGLDAWIVYSGYRLAQAPDPTEVGISERSAQTVLPAR
jgi:hypothetical protein